MAQSSNKKAWLRLGAGVSLLTVSSALGLAAPAQAQREPERHPRLRSAARGQAGVNQPRE